MSMGFFAVFDDIAMLLDDAAAMSKIATKQTVGILGDDLAVSAQQASGFSSSREIPVLWAITKGSFRNKLIILPIAFLLSAFASWSIIPILMLGGVYLAYEGAEKIFEYFFPHHTNEKREELKQLPEDEILKIEKIKIKSAILTDFILSIAIVIMALGTVLEKSLPIQIIAVTFVAIVATIGVYGIVALIVRMDDFGFKLIDMDNGLNGLKKTIGDILVSALPKVIRALTVIGTLAMILVAGGIFTHNIHQLHDALHVVPSMLGDLLVGLILGSVALFFHSIYTKITIKEIS
jgi:predicted DNA repair protein MutK